MVTTINTPCVYIPQTEFRPFIYGLVDPIDSGHVRYVGMAMRMRRPYDHAREARKQQKHSHLFHWIRMLQAAGREPGVIALEYLGSDSKRDFVGKIETMYIASLRSIGHQLTNVSLGGWGGHAWPVGGKHTESTKAKMSVAHKGVSQYWKGEKHGSAKLNEEKVLMIRADARPKSQIAREFGVSVPTIIAIKARTKWSHVVGPASIPSINGRLGPSWNAGLKSSDATREKQSVAGKIAWHRRKKANDV